MTNNQIDTNVYFDDDTSRPITTKQLFLITVALTGLIAYVCSL
jgi:hypothetical protein